MVVDTVVELVQMAVNTTVVLVQAAANIVFDTAKC